MSDNAFHITSEDVRKMEANESKYQGGNVPKDSEASITKSILQEQESKGDQIDRVKANLPLPDQPAGESDWSSGSAKYTSIGVGSGSISEDISKGVGEASGARQGPSSVESSARVDGYVQGKGTAP